MALGNCCITIGRYVVLSFSSNKTFFFFAFPEMFLRGQETPQQPEKMTLLMLPGNAFEVFKGGKKTFVFAVQSQK